MPDSWAANKKLQGFFGTVQGGNPCKARTYSGVEFRARVRVGNDKLFVVKCGIAAKGESARVAALQLHQRFFVFFLQSLQYTWIQNHSDIMNAILVLAHDGVQSSMQFHARSHGSFDDAAPAAVRTILVNRIAQTFLCSLAGHLHQAEL